MPHQKLADRVFVVTGGTQGLGREIALRAARLGARGIVFCGRNEANGRAVAREISEIGTEPLFVPGDLAEVEACRRVVAAADHRRGPDGGRVVY